MPLGLKHKRGEGVNIDARIYVEVVGIDPVVIEVRSREYPFKVLALDHNIIEKINQDIDFCWTYNDSEVVRIVYNAPKEIPIVRVDYTIIEDPWRPVTQDDGISWRDLNLPDSNISQRLLIQKLKDNTTLAYAWAEEIGIGYIAYYLAKNNADYRLVARTIDGKIVSPKFPNKARINYCSIEDEVHHLQTLAKNPDEVLYSFKFVPSRCLFSRAESKTWKFIRKNAKRFRMGLIHTDDLEKLVWQYKQSSLISLLPTNNPSP